MNRTPLIHSFARMAAFVAPALAASIAAAQNAQAFSLPLPMTKLDQGNGTLTLHWADYSGITGWRLHTTTDLASGVWTPLDEAALGSLNPLLLRLDPAGDDTVFPLADTSVTVPTTLEDKQFFRLVAVKGDPAGGCGGPANLAGPDGNGNLYIGTGLADGGNNDIFLLLDAFGNVKHPPGYCTHVPDNPVFVFPDGHGGWTAAACAVSPECHAFPAAVMGYGPQAAQAFTIENPGAGLFTGVTAALAGWDAEAFEISAAPSSTTLGMGDVVTVSVQPKTGLGAGTYSTNLKIRGDDGLNGLALDAIVSFTVNLPSFHSYTLYPRECVFPDAVEDYSAQMPVIFTIANKGTQAYSGLTAALAGADPSAFTINPNLSRTSISTTLSATLSVRPNIGLAAGSYTATLQLRGNNGFSEDVPLSFTVHPAPVFTGIPVAADPAKIAQVMAGALTEARASWWGFDPADSSAFLQAAINSGVPRLIVDDMGAPWVTTPLTGVGDQEIYFEPGVTLLAKRGYPMFNGTHDALLTYTAANNVILDGGAGAAFRMWRGDYSEPPYAVAEWRHALCFLGCSNVVVSGVALEDSGGDGIYIGRGPGPGYLPCRDVTIRDVVCDRNYRQGISVITAVNLLVENTVLRDTSGTSPSAGIDFEPNGEVDRLENCVLRGCMFVNNRIIISTSGLTGNSAPVSIHFENCDVTGRAGNALVILTQNSEEKATHGVVTFTNCVFAGAKDAGISISRKPSHGFGLVFTDCAIAGCGENDVMLASGSESGATHASEKDAFSVDGIRFDNVAVTQPSPRPWIEWSNRSFATLGPPTDITGSVTLATPSAPPQSITLDQAWLDETFPPNPAGELARVAPDMARAAVVDAFGDGSLQPVAAARLRFNARYILHAVAGREVVLACDIIPIGALPANVFTLRGPGGGEIPGLFQPATATNGLVLAFTPETTGFYTLDVALNNGIIRMREANTPVAIDATQGSLAFNTNTGSLWLSVPPDNGAFALAFTAQEGEGIKTSVFDPEGRAWAREPVTNVVRFHVPGEDAAEGLWHLRFDSSAAAYNGTYHAEVLGVPAHIFPSADRYWVFEND